MHVGTFRLVQLLQEGFLPSHYSVRLTTVHAKDLIRGGRPSFFVFYNPGKQHLLVALVSLGEAHLIAKNSELIPPRIHPLEGLYLGMKFPKQQ